MHFEFEAGKVGPLSSGMKRLEVRRILGAKFKEFRKSEFSDNTTDAFDSLGVYVYYSADDIVKGIELFSDAASLAYRDKNLLSLSYSEVRSFLIQEGVPYSEDESQVELLKESIRLYIPDKLDSDDAKIDSAYVILAPV